MLAALPPDVDLPPRGPTAADPERCSTDAAPSTTTSSTASTSDTTTRDTTTSDTTTSDTTTSGTTTSGATTSDTTTPGRGSGLASGTRPRIGDSRPAPPGPVLRASRRPGTRSLDVQASYVIEAWTDAALDERGHDARSPYVERFWLSVLGPSATWLLRVIAYGLDACPDGFVLDCADTARVLGLGEKCGRHSVFMRSLERLCQFDVAEPRPGGLAVRRFLPIVSRRNLGRLPIALQQEHGSWITGSSTSATPATGAGDRPASSEIEALRERAAQLALTLAELGEDRETIESTLARWRFHPAICRATADWAWEQHQLSDQDARTDR